MKGSKTIFAFLSVIFCMLILCSCSEKRINFSMYIDKSPDTLDPQIAYSPSEITSALHLYNGLFRKAPSGKIEANIAKDYSLSNDGLIYTINLHQDKYWHSYKTSSGKITPKLTAQDFVFALQRVFTKSTKSPYADKLNSIYGSKEVLDGTLFVSELGVKALDDYTLEIRLSQADPLFIEKLCCAGAMPCNEEFFNSTNGAYGLSGKTSLCNGDFSLVSWTRDTGIGMKKADAQKGEVNYLRLVLPSHNDADTATERLENGTTDGELIRGYTEDSRFNMQHYSTTVWALCFNNNDKSFANASIRAGLMASFENAVLELDNKSLLPSLGVIPPSITMLDKSYRDIAGNTMPAKQDAATLYRNGLTELQSTQLSGVTVLVPDKGPYAKLFDDINQQWQKELSAFYNIKTLPLNEIQALVNKGEYKIALLPLEQHENNVDSMLTRFVSNDSGNVFGYHNINYDLSIQKAKQSANGIEQANLFANAESILLRDAPIIPVFYETSTFLTASWVNDILLSPYGPVIDVSFAHKK
ncbi:MAG: peptide ABC transporter substrate-binding protein [Oscillospiraceae bacterium]